MGYNLGAIIVGARYGGREADLLMRIRPGAYRAAGSVSLAEATRRECMDSAVGVVDGATLLLDQFLPYDCSFQEERLSYLDRSLAALSQEVPVFCLLIDETSMSFGFSYFDGGRRVRVRQVDPDGIVSDAGTPLPAEAGFPDDSHDDTARIMAITASMLGKPLDQLIVQNRIVLTRYVEDPKN